MIADCYHQLVDEMDTARSIQLELVALMEPGSRRAGYKVGLTDSKAQEMFAISQPLVGFCSNTCCCRTARTSHWIPPRR